PALLAADDELAAALVAEHGNYAGFLFELDEQPDRLAMSAPARQLRRLDGVTAPIGRKHQKLRRRLGKECELAPVVGFERQTGEVCDLAAQRANPSFFGNHDGDRLALDERFFDRRFVVRRRLGKTGAALAERRLRAEFLAHLANLAGNRFPLRLFGAQQILERFLLRAEVFVLLSDFHLLELAQIAEPHVENGLGLNVRELEGLDQHRLGLILGADDLDDLVEIEIGDQITAEHLQAVLNLAEPITRAAQENLAPLRAPFVDRLRKPDHLRYTAAHQYVHVQRYAAFKLGKLEQALHHQRRIDAARARLEHQSHILGGFVAHVGDERQLFFVDQLGDALDE